MCKETLDELRAKNRDLDEDEARMVELGGLDKAVCGSFRSAILFLLDASLQGGLVPERLKEATLEYRRFLDHPIT